jgi:hypothetical protein
VVCDGSGGRERGRDDGEDVEEVEKSEDIKLRDNTKEGCVAKKWKEFRK